MNLKETFFGSTLRLHTTFVVLEILCSILVLAHYTTADFKPLPQSFNDIVINDARIQVLDRNGIALKTEYKENWNTHDRLELHEIPEFVKQAFIVSEDKRFYEHSGVDWTARLHAATQNLKNLSSIRGASTISEQVIKMLHNRPRSVWSKWVEGWEAKRLEKYFNKDEILTFYINQVPYASNRRGIAQAARHYFNRDISTLNKKETLALIVLIRAPSRLDLYKTKGKKQIEKSINLLAQKLYSLDIISKEETISIKTEKLTITPPSTPPSASHFVDYVVSNSPQEAYGVIKTTLDANLQKYVEHALNRQIASLENKNAKNGAILIADHQTGEILTWAVARGKNKNVDGSYINAVTTPRQPGSSTKPLLYALALEKGWTVATIIDDSPLSESVGYGLHAYQNYSHTYYGKISLRKALGNSLNIPAVKTLQYVSAKTYLNTLSKMGIKRLKKHPDFYGDGIALGNAEITLFELVQAYTSLANRGILNPLKFNYDEYANNIEPRNNNKKRIYSEEAVSIIGNILSDSDARSLEFSGNTGTFDLPIQTAIKTGTSNDYRDAWVVAYNYRYIIGIWFGNLDRTPMNEITGSIGPAPLLKTIFAKLIKRDKATKPLFLSPKLISADICINENSAEAQNDNKPCNTRNEWFIKGTFPQNIGDFLKASEDITSNKIKLYRPTNGLQLAYDPRLEPTEQAFEFIIKGINETDVVEWSIDGKTFKSTGSKYQWQLERGNHKVSATIFRKNKMIHKSKKVSFIVK